MAISLKAARVNAGLTQKDVAESVGVNVSTVSFWETGKTTPKLDVFFELCKLYALTPNDIFLPTKSS